MKYTVYSEAESPFTCDFLNEGEVGSKVERLYYRLISKVPSPRFLKKHYLEPKGKT